MIKEKALCNVLLFSFFSTISMADDFNAVTEYQNNSSTASIDSLLATSTKGAECITIDDSTGNAVNTGDFCFKPDSISDNEDAQDATSMRAGIPTRGRPRQVGAQKSECFSIGGSSAESEQADGFCLASDLNTSDNTHANFATANELPVVGMQFLQAVFKDGSQLGASIPIDSECMSAGGSLSTSGNFCMASDISKSLSTFTNFAIANGLPIVGLQFLQVLFANDGSSMGINTRCVSIGGSTASSGSTTGFCLVSDLSTSIAGSANFSVAHGVPVTDLQFLQIMFEASNTAGESLLTSDENASIGAECLSTEGSIAAIQNPAGFCFISDLIESSFNSANIAIANNLSVSGMQFLQVKFADNPSPNDLSSSSGRRDSCVSDNGSIATSGSPEGFCLVSDLINSTIESANISIANNLPVVAWEFLQVPSNNVPPLVSSSNSDVGAPVGVIVSGFVDEIFNQVSPPVIMGAAGNRSSFFHLSNQTNGIEAFSTPYWRTYPHLQLRTGR